MFEVLRNTKYPLAEAETVKLPFNPVDPIPLKDKEVGCAVGAVQAVAIVMVLLGLLVQVLFKVVTL